MTVKEVEKLTGMTRANIRYYEMEGLIAPKRNENGHREYSEKDVDELNKIKLLRTLYISIEEIKELKENQKALSEVLKVQIEKLERERKSVVQAMDICRLMQNDGVDFASLNAAYYFAQLNRSTHSENEVLKTDRILQERIPVRRLLARGIDTSFYTIIWHGILILLLGMNPQKMGVAGELVDIIIVWLLMIIVESFLLSRVGTTLGKWIFGIKVTNLDDGRLTFTEACVRCVNVFIYGYGCEIPIYGWWKQYKCYEDCSSGVPLKWEEDSCVVLKDKKGWRIVVYSVAAAVIVGIEFLMSCYANLPPNCGEITVAEFSENYNELANENKVLSAWYLNEEGEWEPKYLEEDVTDRPDSNYVKFYYIEEYGLMKGLIVSGKFAPSLYYEEIQNAMQSFFYAKEPKCVMTGEVQKAYDRIMDLPDMESETFEVCGVRMTNINQGESFVLEMKIVE